MTIERIGVTSDYGPLMSRCIIHNDTVLLSGIVAGDLSQSTEMQTRDVLRTIDGLLAEARTNRENILTVHIWLANMEHFQDNKHHPLTEKMGAIFHLGNILAFHFLF